MSTLPEHPDQTLVCLGEVIKTLTGDVDIVAATGAAAVSGNAETLPAAPTAIKHERPTPEHWDDIVHLAETLPVFLYTFDSPYLTEPVQLYHPSSVNTLRKRLSSLTDDELDELRFHGIGLLLCDFAQTMRDPAARKHMVDSAAEAMYNLWKLSRNNNFRPENISTIMGGAAGFGEAIHTAFNNTPQHIQLLNDVLHWNQNERKAALQRGGLPEDHTYLSRGYHVGNGHPNGDCVTDIAAATLVGSSRTLRRILELRAQYLADRNPAFPADANVQQIIDHTNMSTLNLIPVAQRAAAMRLDEFNVNAENHISLDENGNAVFSGKGLPRSRDLTPAPMPAQGSTLGTPLHTRRLRCPALFVEALIPDIVDCLVDVAQKADQFSRERPKPSRHQ